MNSKIKRALISVSDKAGIVEFAKELEKFNIEILSTGGTAKILKKKNIKLKEVSEYTGFPEIMNGRVKTLHPKIHGALLALRNNEEHLKQAEENSIEFIDMVIVNLYPFEKIIEKENCSFEDAIENIDIGGPTMIRSAAKNYKNVVVIIDKSDYTNIIEELKKTNNVSLRTREKLAVKVFEYINKYDFAIEKYLKNKLLNENIEQLRIKDQKEFGKYAENWHQKGKIGKLENSVSKGIIDFKQINGNKLGYNNYLDSDSALNIIKEFNDKPATVVIKHGNPCGLAVSKTLENSLERAWQGDPVSAFGSVIAFNREVDIKTAEVICKRKNSQGKKGWFIEILLAPSFSKEAYEYLSTRKSKKNLRIFETGKLSRIDEFEYRSISGGILVQEKDNSLYLTSKFDDILKPAYKFNDNSLERVIGIVTENKNVNKLKGLLEFSVIASKHTRSNAISIVRKFGKENYQIIGMGAGQPNRKDSTSKLALTKAVENLTIEYNLIKGNSNGYYKDILKSEIMNLTENKFKNMSLNDYITYQFENFCVLSSDAFFPFEDGIIDAAEAGIKYIIQPGGSKGDEMIIKKANEYNICMIFTGMRHFRH